MSDKLLYEQKLFSSRNYASETEFLNKILKSVKIKNRKRLLDIGCNIGKHAHLFAQKGYLVTGIDVNPKLINYAKKHVTDAEFINADMRTFKPSEKFDAAISIFNGIYFNKTKKELLSAFRNIYKNLEFGAPLIFDVGSYLLKDNFVNRRSSLMGYNDKNLQIARFGIIQKIKNNLKFKLNYLVKDHNSFLSYSENITFGFFSTSEVKNLIKKAGFRVIKVKNESQFRPNSTFFICIK